MSQTITMLVVDDEPSILSNLVELFKDEFIILTAPNAGKAKEILGREKIHVIVSDYKMPGQDGLSFLIESKKSHPESIRVLMTAYADMNLVIRAMNEGEIHRFVSKPFRMFEFRRILKDCLQLSQIVENKESLPKKGNLVLVAHDSQITISTIRLVLTPTYEIVATSNGLEVLSLLSSHRVDAIILGVGLEHMDGCTITSYLKKGKSGTVPIIVWCKTIDAPFEEYLKECGADYWIDGSNAAAASQLQQYLREALA